MFMGYAMGGCTADMQIICHAWMYIYNMSFVGDWIYC